MLHLVQTDRAYSPEAIAVMTAAFERVCASLSKRMNGNDDVKERLARAILRYIDGGERDPERIADLAFRECAGVDQSALGNRSATG